MPSCTHSGLAHLTLTKQLTLLLPMKSAVWQLWCHHLNRSSYNNVVGLEGSPTEKEWGRLTSFNAISPCCLETTLCYHCNTGTSIHSSVSNDNHNHIAQSSSYYNARYCLGLLHQFFTMAAKRGRNVGRRLESHVVEPKFYSKSFCLISCIFCSHRNI